MYDIEWENAQLRRRIGEVEARLDTVRRPCSPGEVAALAKLQSRADSIAAKFGERAPSPRAGESPEAYRVRTLRGLQRHAPAFADFDLGRADSVLLDVAEGRILAAAEQAARSGTETAAPLVKVEERDAAGRLVTKFYGDPLAWMAPFMSGAAVCRVARPGFNRE